MHNPKESILGVPGSLGKFHGLHELPIVATRILVHHHLRSGQISRGLHDGAVSEYASGRRLSSCLDDSVFVSVRQRVDDGL